MVVMLCVQFLALIMEANKSQLVTFMVDVHSVLKHAQPIQEKQSQGVMYMEGKLCVLNHAQTMQARPKTIVIYMEGGNYA